MADIIRLVKDKEPLSPKPKRCWLLHEWGQWKRVSNLFQEKQCTRCGLIKDRII